MIYRVLARKYRPQILSDLKGQDNLVQSLKQNIADGRVPHAFLFNGIRGVGKTTTARIIAKALNCVGIDGKGGMTPDPCGVCASCKAIQEDRHLDVVEMDAASHTGVDDIRELIESTRYKAVQGRFKVFIIDEVHMLSKSAFNALLKTLEEPPAHVKFIFATTELRKIPDTILSRCQRFDLKRMDQSLLVSYLGELVKKEEFEASDLALSVLARAADGSMRDGVSLLDQAIALTQAQQKTQINVDLVRSMLGQADRGFFIDLVESLFSGDVPAALKLTRAMLDTGTDAASLLQDTLDFIYAQVTYKTQKMDDAFWSFLGLSDSELKRFYTLSDKVQLSFLLQSWQVLSKGYEELLKSPLQAQTLEMILIRLCYIVPLTIFEAQKKTLELGESLQNESISVDNSPISISTFDELLKILEEKKEMLLVTALRYDAHLVSFKLGHIILRIADQATSNFIQPLKLFLESVTNVSWVLEVTKEGGDQTLAQKKKGEQDKINEEALNQSVVKAILEVFPKSEITV